VGRKKMVRKAEPPAKRGIAWPRWTGFRGMTVRDWLQLLVGPVALVVIGFVFTMQQDVRQQAREERQRAEEAQQRAQEAESQTQYAALQAYLDQMNSLMLEKERGLLRSKVGDTVFTLAQARTTAAITQFDGKQNQIVTRFLSDSGLLREPPLLANTDLEGAQLHKAVLPYANLTDTDLQRANLTDALLFNADFYAVEKVGKGTQVTTANLTKADLSRAALKEADLSECYLKEATLTDVTLQDADLRGAYLQGADLSHAALQGANLSPATVPNFPGEKMPTNLTDADLRDTALQYANLSRADLTDADLTDADLTDADLTDARGWTMEQLTAARSLEGATMPNGQMYENWLKSKGSREDG
jgi:uncharacterized protein YjbI with pentapeptide repeats